MKHLRTLLAFALATTACPHARAADGDLEPLDLAPPINEYFYLNSATELLDGKLMVVGTFGTIQGVSRPNGIARLNADGSLDTTWTIGATGIPLFGGGTLTPGFNQVLVQPNGGLVLSGSYGSLQPNGVGPFTTRRGTARLNPDGSLDMAFDPNPNATPNQAVLQPDGKILVFGWFGTPN